MTKKAVNEPYSDSDSETELDESKLFEGMSTDNNKLCGHSCGRHNMPPPLQVVS